MYLRPLLHSEAGEPAAQRLAMLPLWLRVAIVTRAAVYEEVVYRGFGIERLAEAGLPRAFAALASLAAFTLAHLYGWNWQHLLVAAFGGAVLTGLYLWRRDLVATMVAHLFTDAVGFLLA